jgi:hypothetical protein
MTQISQRHLELVAITIRIGFVTARRSRAALKALIPDNIRFPKGLSVKMSSKGSSLFIRVRGEKIPMNTILSTIDEILEHASMCQKVMSK